MTKQTNKGFSLIEIMIALSLLAGVSLFIVKLSKRGIDVKKTVNADFEIAQFYNHIGKLVLSKETCELNFGGPGNTVSPPSPYIPRNFNINRPDFRVPTSPPAAPTSSGEVLYKADSTTKYGDNNFVITEMRIQKDSPGNFAYYVSTRKLDKDAKGGKDLKKRFPLAVKLNAAGTQIVSCYQTQDEQAEIVCDSLEGYQWNGSTKQCEKVPVTSPITVWSRTWTNTGTSTIYNQDFCSLARVRFGDAYKDSSTQECELRKIGIDVWTIKRWKEEARDLYCGVMCFKFN